jgi:hypothetical protein
LHIIEKRAYGLSDKILISTIKNKFNSPCFNSVYFIYGYSLRLTTAFKRNFIGELTMANEALTRKYPVILVAVVMAGLFAAGICLAADDSDNDKSEEATVEIPKRVQEAIAEVDEFSKAEKEKLESIKRQQYLDEYHDEPAGELLTKEELDEIEQQKKAKEKTIRAKAQEEIGSIQEEAQKETQEPAEDISPAQFKHRPAVVSYAEGTVTGIVLYLGKGAALILGDVVRENDVIRGIKIVKIMPDYVEFEKQGRTWKQEVGQTPPKDVWEKPKSQQQMDAGRKR